MTEQSNYVGLPDLEPGRCGWSLDLASTRCRAPADSHLLGTSPFGDVALATCAEHEPHALASLTAVLGSHSYGPGCHGASTTWMGDHCEQAAEELTAP